MLVPKENNEVATGPAGAGAAPPAAPNLKLDVSGEETGLKDEKSDLMGEAVTVFSGVAGVGAVTPAGGREVAAPNTASDLPAELPEKLKELPLLRENVPPPTPAVDELLLLPKLKASDPKLEVLTFCESLELPKVTG